MFDEESCSWAWRSSPTRTDRRRRLHFRRVRQTLRNETFRDFSVGDVVILSRNGKAFDEVNMALSSKNIFLAQIVDMVQLGPPPSPPSDSDSEDEADGWDAWSHFNLVFRWFYGQECPDTNQLAVEERDRGEEELRVDDFFHSDFVDLEARNSVSCVLGKARVVQTVGEARKVKKEMAVRRRETGESVAKFLEGEGSGRLDVTENDGCYLARWFYKTDECFENARVQWLPEGVLKVLLESPSLDRETFSGHVMSVGREGERRDKERRGRERRDRERGREVGSKEVKIPKKKLAEGRDRDVAVWDRRRSDGPSRSAGSPVKVRQTISGGVDGGRKSSQLSRADSIPRKRKEFGLPLSMSPSSPLRRGGGNLGLSHRHSDSREVTPRVSSNPVARKSKDVMDVVSKKRSRDAPKDLPLDSGRVKKKPRPKEVTRVNSKLSVVEKRKGQASGVDVKRPGNSTMGRIGAGAGGAQGAGGSKTRPPSSHAPVGMFDDCIPTFARCGGSKQKENILAMYDSIINALGALALEHEGGLSALREDPVALKAMLMERTKPVNNSAQVPAPSAEGQ